MSALSDFLIVRLQVCKLVLSLDPEGDPAGALFCVDYYALRSEQFEYLERLADELDAERSLRVLPNFAFSLAMARFRLEERQNRCDKNGHRFLAKFLRCAFKMNAEMLSFRVHSNQCGMLVEKWVPHAGNRTTP